jgi:hypothetical protein
VGARKIDRDDRRVFRIGKPLDEIVAASEEQPKLLADICDCRLGDAGRGTEMT